MPLRRYKAGTAFSPAPANHRPPSVNRRSVMKLQLVEWFLRPAPVAKMWPNPRIGPCDGHTFLTGVWSMAKSPGARPKACPIAGSHTMFEIAGSLRHQQLRRWRATGRVPKNGRSSAVSQAWRPGEGR